MKPSISFPPHLQSQINEITKILSKHTKRAYFVGGCVRDLYLGSSIKDIDIEVYDIQADEFDALMQSINAQGVGKSFFVYKYKDLDLALPRLEKKVALGHKGFEVTITQDEKEASSRRDFTMNSLLVNIFDFTVLDFYDGIEAIENRCIKHIEEESFKEDSLRVLRAVQFSARFGFDIDKNSLCLMKSIDLKDLSKTRIFWELEKFFKAKFLHVGLKYFYELGLFEKIFNLHVKKEQVKKTEEKLLTCKFSKELQEYYFLYVVSNILNVNVFDILKLLEVPNRYLKVFKYQPYFDKMPSDKELFEIASVLPIKKWLGNCDERVVIRAKELGIYEDIFTGGVLISEVIKDGFEKENIKKEYAKRVRKKIEEKCK